MTLVISSGGSCVGTTTAGDDEAALGATSSIGVDGMEHIGNGAPHVGWYGGPLHICMSIQAGEPNDYAHEV